jgi:hypothetical protein
MESSSISPCLKSRMKAKSDYFFQCPLCLLKHHITLYILPIFTVEPSGKLKAVAPFALDLLPLRNLYSAGFLILLLDGFKSIVFGIRKPEPKVSSRQPELQLGDSEPIFKLRIGSNGSDISNPQMIAITKALRELSGLPDDFVILSRTDLNASYIQTLDGPEKFTLEYRDGDSNRHFECKAKKDEVIDAFAAYRATDPSFRSVCAWEWLDLGR